MPLYESTFIVRQDVSVQEVENLTENFLKVINDNDGKAVKTEQWGLRDLSYPIKKSTKGYYVFFALDAPSLAIKEMEKKIKLNENVIRLAVFKVNSFEESPSPLISQDEGGEEIVIGAKGNNIEKDS